MKKILCAVLCLVLLLPMTVSCSRKPEYAEIEERLKTLVAASAEINMIFFGTGLPVYERITDPRTSTEVYEDEETGARYHYYELEDEKLGRIVAFRQSTVTNVYKDKATGKKYFYYEITDRTYGRVVVVNAAGDEEDFCLQLLEAPREGESPFYFNASENLYGYILEDFTYVSHEKFSYVQVVTEPREGEEAYWIDGKCYCYLLSDQEYVEPTYESFYDENDPLDYDYVTADSPYLSIDSIKAAASEVYSKEYLESIYSTLFIGSMGAADSVVGGSARYIEYADDDGMVSLMMSNTVEPLITETRVFDFSTAKMVKPSNAKYVTISIESYLPSDPSNRVTVRLSMTLQNGSWMLDSATY